MPDPLDDRAADVWEPLLAIADSAGGDWPERGRKAALTLSMGEGRDDDSLRVRLLADIRTAFSDREVDKLASKELVQSLSANEEAPWGDLRGRPLDTRQLARMLKPYGVRPHQVRLADKTLKGYESADFRDDWARYLPPLIPPGSETSETRETNPSPRLNLKPQDVSGVSDVSPNRGMQAPSSDRASVAENGRGTATVPACMHRPPGEVEDLWRMGETTWGDDPCICGHCGAPVLLDQFDDSDGRWPTCRDGAVAPQRGGHLVRLAHDLGGTLITEEEAR